MPRRTAGRVHPLAPGIVLLLLIASMAPSGAGQGPGAPQPCEPGCLAIRSLGLGEGRSAVTAEGDNTIQAVIANDGSTPKEVRAHLEFVWIGGSASSPPTTYIIPAGWTQTVSEAWEGPPVPDGASSVGITVKAWVQASGQRIDDTDTSKTITRPVETNDFAMELVAGSIPDEVALGTTGPIALVKITNLGNTPDTASWVAVDAGDWSIAPGSTSILEPGQSQTVSIQATAPDVVGQPSAYTLEARTSQGRTIDPLRAVLAVSSPAIVDGDELRVNFPDSAKAADPGGSVTYEINVYNPTSQATNVEATLQDAPAGIGLSLSPSGPQSVPVGQSVTFLLHADVDTAALHEMHSWAVRIQEPSGATPFQADLDVSLTVNQIHAVALDTPAAFADPVEVSPGQPVEVDLHLINLGNGVVTICVEAALPEGWSHVEDCLPVGAQADASGAAGWYKMEPFTWTMMPPTSTEASDREIAVSATDTVVQSDSLTIRFTVLERTAPIIDVPDGHFRPLWFEMEEDEEVVSWPEMDDDQKADMRALLGASGFAFADPADGPEIPVARFPCTLGVEPGKQLLIPIGLRNEGNVDGDFVFSIDVVEEGSWTIADPPASHVLAAGAQQTFDIAVTAPTIAAPGLALPGDFAIIDLLLEEVDDHGDPIPGRVAGASCVVHAAFPDLAILPAAPSSSPQPLYTDHPAVLHFDLFNAGWAGTGPVHVRSVIEGPDGFLLEQDHEVQGLEAYPGTWWRPLAVHFKATEAGGYTYTLRVDPDHAVEEFEDSDDADGVAPNRITGTVGLRDFGVAVAAPSGREVIPEQVLSFEEVTDSAFVVKNVPDEPGDCSTGQTYTLTLHLVMEPAWKTFDKESVTLAPCDEHIVEFAVKVPKNPFVPEAVVTLHASNDEVPTLIRQDTVRLRVDDDEPPTITEFSSNVSHVLVGGSVDFLVDITDAAGVDEARLILVAPDGTVSEHPMQGGLIGSFAASASFKTLGHHDAYVWARDAAVSQNTVDTSSSPVQIEVLSDDVPHLRLVDPSNGSHLRPGVPVVLTVLSKYPVVDAHYDLGGGEVVVPYANPLQLATDDWADGPTDVHVTVRDALGMEAEDSYSFTIDGTPPVVADFQLDPAAPGLVRVVAIIEDEYGVEEAEIRITRAGGETDTVALVKDGSTWEAEVALPTDVASATVVATDAAGNRGFGEKVLQVQSADKGTPGTALGLLVAALAALARRRGPR